MINDCSTAIVTKVKKFSQLFEDANFNELLEISIRNQKQLHQENLSPDNIENIETGVSGFLFFLLEFYKCNPSIAYKTQIKNVTNDLIEYCKNNPTSNYSLYTGRGGFVYFLLQLYNFSNEEYLLDEAQALMKPAAGEYLDSRYSSDYLYNGRAGTLLVLLQLYQLKNESDTLGLITKFTNKILHNAKLSDEGISWKATEEINLKNSCGFALGAGGILFVLKQFNLLFPNAAVEYCINCADKYVMSCWSEGLQKWLNYEKDIFNGEMLSLYKDQYQGGDERLFEPSIGLAWSDGKLGIQLVTGSNSFKWSELEKVIGQNSLNIYDGLAGIGLCLLTMKGDHEEALAHISNLLLKNQAADTMEGGLLLGDLGVYYFLLKYIFREKNNNTVIIPDIQGVIKPNEIKIDVRLSEVKKILLKTYYSRTIEFLEKMAPTKLDVFLSTDNDNKNEINRFQAFLADILLTRHTMPAHPLLADVFALENKRLDFFKGDNRTNLQVYLELLFINENALTVLNKPDEWIFNQQIGISKKIIVANSKWDWVSTDDADFTENFYHSPGHYEYLFFCTAENRMSESSLKIDGLVVHCFDEPKTVNQALTQIKHFCKSQSRQNLEEFSVSTGSRNVDDFISRLDFLVTHKVKQLIYDGILILVA